MHGVAFARLAPSSSLTVLRDVDSPCHTIRSFPDPPGNCLVLDTRFEPPIVRPLVADEIWRIQGRCDSQLDLLQTLGTSDEDIIAKAGNAVTGAMAAYMAEALATRVPQLKAATTDCLSPLAEPLGSQVLVVLISGVEQKALVACEGAMLPGFTTARSRESAVSLAARFVVGCTGHDLPTFLAGQQERGSFQQWIVACPSATSLVVLQPWAQHLA